MDDETSTPVGVNDAPRFEPGAHLRGLAREAGSLYGPAVSDLAGQRLRETALAYALTGMRFQGADPADTHAVIERAETFRAYMLGRWRTQS